MGTSRFAGFLLIDPSTYMNILPSPLIGTSVEAGQAGSGTQAPDRSCLREELRSLWHS